MVSLLATLLAAPVFAQTDLGEKALDAAQAEERGFDYWVGRGVTRDPAEAAKWLEQAATAGRPYAIGLLADLYRLGEGVQPDEQRARELNLQAAALGVAPAQARLGYDTAFAQDPAARDPASAVQWLNAAAEQEHGPALYVLGQLYFFGQGVEADADIALRLITRAAELGHPQAQAAVASRMLDGDHAGDDVQRGLYFARTAAASGHGAGAYLLARLYLAGRYVERDAGLAAQWLTRASELEVPVAMLWLAELYAKGLGVGADAGRAAELRERVLSRLPVGARNAFAWELAVSPEAELRNGAFAVEIMEGVAAERPTAAYLDTLAAAYAEAGRFDDAVRAQQRAIDALSESDDAARAATRELETLNSVTAATRDSFVERMELYRTGKPYREPL